MLVKQIMSQPAVTCRVDENLNQAALLMWQHDCGVIPITDESGRAIAMLTDRDVCMAACTQGRPLPEINVRTAMSPALHVCSPEDTIEHAAQLMRQHQVRRLPVVREDGRPVGVISLNDLSLLAVRQHPAALRSPDAISLSKAVQTFAAVCSHRGEIMRQAG